jgi:hypothetical protein
MSRKQRAAQTKPLKPLLLMMQRRRQRRKKQQLIPPRSNCEVCVDVELRDLCGMHGSKLFRAVPPASVFRVRIH